MTKYQSLKILFKRTFDPKFRKERNEFLEKRRWDYQSLNGLYKEALLDEAHKREAELIEKERRFGVKHDFSLYEPVGVVLIRLPITDDGAATHHTGGGGGHSEE
jgi:hypothetical protein